MQLPWQCAYARSQGRTTYHIIIQPIMSIFFCIELSLASYMIALLTCCSIQALHCWSCRDSRDPGQVKKRRPEIGKNNRQKKKKKKPIEKRSTIQSTYSVLTSGCFIVYSLPLQTGKRGRLWHSGTRTLERCVTRKRRARPRRVAIAHLLKDQLLVAPRSKTKTARPNWYYWQD